MSSTRSGSSDPLIALLASDPRVADRKDLDDLVSVLFFVPAPPTDGIGLRYTKAENIANTPGYPLSVTRVASCLNDLATMGYLRAWPQALSPLYARRPVDEVKRMLDGLKAADTPAADAPAAESDAQRSAAAVALADALRSAEALAKIVHDPMFADCIGPKLTCDEAEAFAAFIVAWAAPTTRQSPSDLAQMFLTAHADGDDEGDDHFHLKP